MNSYYEDPHKSVGAFDFVMANPPFNVNAVDMAKLSAVTGPGRRFPFGTPSVDNANYLWIQLFYSSLSEKGRSGFVMANSASDARGSEQAIRQQLIEAKAVDVMVAVGPNMFYTVTLPCTLWFFDRGKVGTKRENTVLFLDARHLYRQIDRAHRDWSESQTGFLANIVRLYRGEAVDVTLGGEEAQRWIEAFSVPTPAARPPIATLPACARRPPSTRSKPRAGASIPAAMWVWRRGKTSAMRTSRSSWRRSRRN